MPLLFTFTEPITVGDFNQRITVKAFKLTSLSLNFEDVYQAAGVAMLSACFVDPDTGYPLNIVERDAGALAMAELIESQIGPELFAKFQTDGRLPAGTLAYVEPAPPILPPTQLGALQGGAS